MKLGTLQTHEILNTTMKSTIETMKTLKKKSKIVPLTTHAIQAIHIAIHLAI